MGKILTVKGMVYHLKLENFKEAEECYKQGLLYKKKISDQTGQAITNGMLGKLYFKQGTDLKKDQDDTLTSGAWMYLENAIVHFEENIKLSNKIDSSIG